MEEDGGDTIPGQIKAKYFGGKKKPDLLDDYDVVGFDADHSLLNFKEEEVIKLLVKCYLDDLFKEFGYPEEILNFDYEKNL